jgi:hypothetical protein
MRRTTWLVYAALQVTGEICQWTWPLVHSDAGRWLWIGAFIFLFPGNLLAGFVVERALWNSGLTLRTLQMLQVPLAIFINLALWIVCAWFSRWMAARISVRKTGHSL